jgi:hypothetical protein
MKYHKRSSTNTLSLLFIFMTVPGCSVAAPGADFWDMETSATNGETSSDPVFVSDMEIDSDADSDTDGDTDMDSDADSDSDMDSDSDADADADTDSDSDSDKDTGTTGMEPDTGSDTAGQSPCDACDEHAFCDETQETPVCTCRPGWAGNGVTCYDVDECANGAADCSQLCANKDGGYTCGCVAGYSLDTDGRSCIDVDECAEGEDPCDPAHGICTNEEGGYTCSCADGRELSEDGVRCRNAFLRDQVTTGDHHVCALQVDGTIVCWGNNQHGQSVPPSGTFLQVSAKRDIVWRAVPCIGEKNEPIWGEDLLLATWKSAYDICRKCRNRPKCRDK